MRALLHLDAGLERLCGFLDIALRWLAVAALMALSMSTMIEVLIRYVFSVPPRWAGGEVPSILLLWVTATGIVIAVRRIAHLRLDLMPTLLRPRQAALIQVGVDIASLFFMMLLAYLVYEFAVDNLRTQMPGLGISYGWANTSLLFGAGLSSLYYLKQVSIGLVTAFGRQPDEPTP